MVAILLTILNVVFVILIIYPLKIILRVVRKIDSKRANEQLKKLSYEAKISLDDAEIAKKNEEYAKANLIIYKLRAKKTFLEARIALRKSTFKVIRFVLNLFQFSSLLSAILVSILLGVSVLFALNMSTLIPVWNLAQSNEQTTTQTETKKDDSKGKDKKSDGNAKNSPNDAMSVFIRLKSKPDFNEVWATAFVGNLMEETGGGTYNFMNENDSQHGGMGGLGIVQWTNGRASILRAKPNYTDINVQVDYIIEEMNGAESAMYNFIRKNPNMDLAEATRSVARIYERCNALYIEKRVPNSQKFWDEYVGNKKYKEFE